MDQLLYFLSRMDLPDAFPYLLGILGLALIWKFHDMQVKAGRIKAKDFWERSGVRLFLRATPDDAHTCDVCKETVNVVFLPSLVTSKKFAPHEKPCTNPNGCRCVMIGLYGGWAQAGLALAEAKKDGGRARLSDADMKTLIDKSLEARAGASADRMSLRMLNAMRAEGSTPDVAIEN